MKIKRGANSEIHRRWQSRNRVRVMRYTSPLGLLQEGKIPSYRLDLLPVIDFLIIIFLFFLLSSDFIFSRGLLLELPVQSSAGQQSVRTDVVMSVTRGGNIIFEDQGLDMESLPEAIAVYMERFAGPERPVLLLKLDNSLPFQKVASVLDVLTSAGFAEVLVAYESLD